MTKNSSFDRTRNLHRPKFPAHNPDQLRIVNVGYLNSAPYRILKDVPGALYIEEPPAECARMLHEGECDLALIPAAEYLLSGCFTALPFGIAARGPVDSVMLFANRPLEELDRVLVDSTSHSSVMLLRVLLEQLLPKRSRRIAFHRMGWHDLVPAIDGTTAGLVIGDRALALRDRFPYQLDLAERWFELTGLPFVFAVWAVDPARCTESIRRTVIDYCTMAAAQRVVFGRDWAEEHSIDRNLAEAYVTTRIRYALDEEAIAGLDRFHRLGLMAGLFPRAYPPVVSATSAPCTSRPAGRRRMSVDAILDDASSGQRISIENALVLADQAPLADLGLAADAVRRRLHSQPGVSYIVDRNINYTNVCNVYCRFCAFYRAPGHGAGYLLSKEEIGQKIEAMLEQGGIQILLQGGLNPELGIEYYEDLFRWIKDRYPVNLHALSADEILHISRVSHLTIEETLGRLADSGLGSLPGGGAEILVDSVRRRIARLKSTSQEWLEVHRVAHRIGLSSTCTMMFGVKETWSDRLSHMHKLRHLQDETGGFTAFISWPFQDENTKLEAGDTSAPEYLRVQSIARLFLDNIPNIQSSWVTMGPSVGQVALSFGANDFGSVMFEENVVSSAGTTYCMTKELIERHIREAGFFPWQRDVHYGAVPSS